jgi:ubiquinone biosynthesis protein COQ9
MWRRAAVSLRLPAAARAPRRLYSAAPDGGGGQQLGLDDAELRARLVEAALAEVPAHGWSVEALAAGASACGLSPMAHGMLPRGPVELVEHFSAVCDATLAQELQERASDLEGLRAHNRLLVAMQARLRLVAPYAASWPQALALRALPSNLPSSLRDAHSVSSLLLDACGEDARAPLLPGPVDHHAKLLSVGALYGAAELYLITDDSPDHADTWAFLEREIEALRSVATNASRLPDLSPAGLLVAALTSRKPSRRPREF